MTRWLKEPLLHFLLIGAGLFMLYGWASDEDAGRPDQIIFAETEVDRLINLWERKWQRLPSQTELQGLIEQQIREEVFYREALAMGLDKNDTVVRRRMAQKLEFISNDLASLAEPDDALLQTYLDEHQEKFLIPGRISYSQVFLNRDKRGRQVYAAAAQLLEELSQSPVDVDTTMAGDPFMGGYRFNDETDFGVSRVFGQDFASEIFKLPVGTWTGPVESGYGLHLVRVDARTDAVVPTLGQVRDKVRNEWLADQRRKTNDLLYSELRKRYEVIIEGAGPGSSATVGSE
ncbi:MAG: peptidyl-prolyl cis-trans isomerase [Gammaproteobacteria bacterium]|nr:peptidyl-prolyl cis-trans isomerase [Gammaproteobacteria bacterium]NNK98417.1 peptidyl-prolyl cis-trans isomerase [Xanthomonadales bacterium]